MPGPCPADNLKKPPKGGFLFVAPCLHLLLSWLHLPMEIQEQKAKSEKKKDRGQRTDE